MMDGATLASIVDDCKLEIPSLVWGIHCKEIGYHKIPSFYSGMDGMNEVFLYNHPEDELTADIIDIKKYYSQLCTDCEWIMREEGNEDYFKNANVDIDIKRSTFGMAVTREDFKPLPNTAFNEVVIDTVADSDAAAKWIGIYIDSISLHDEKNFTKLCQLFHTSRPNCSFFIGTFKPNNMPSFIGYVVQSKKHPGVAIIVTVAALLHDRDKGFESKMIEKIIRTTSCCDTFCVYAKTTAAVQEFEKMGFHTVNTYSVFYTSFIPWQQLTYDLDAMVKRMHEIESLDIKKYGNIRKAIRLMNQPIITRAFKALMSESVYVQLKTNGILRLCYWSHCAAEHVFTYPFLTPTKQALPVLIMTESTVDLGETHIHFLEKCIELLSCITDRLELESHSYMGPLEQQTQWIGCVDEPVKKEKYGKDIRF